MKLVLDASVVLAWLLEDAGQGQVSAAATLARLSQPGAEAWVPAIWSLEVGNVLVRAEARGQLPAARIAPFLHVLSRLPLRHDTGTADRALRETLAMARQYRLSTYDASYLELAQRQGMPLATLDGALQAAAVAAGLTVVGHPTD